MRHDIPTDDERWLQLVRLDRWLKRRYATRGWRRARVWVEDIAVGLAIGLLAVWLSRCEGPRLLGPWPSADCMRCMTFLQGINIDISLIINIALGIVLGAILIGLI